MRWRSMTRGRRGYEELQVAPVADREIGTTEERRARQ